MYYDLLAKIKNAQAAKKESLLAPFSKMDFAVAELLRAMRFVGDVQKKTMDRKNMIEIKLLYGERGPALSDFKILSKPSRHLYAGYRDLKAVKSGYGFSVLSTPKGIVTHVQARKQKVGGEYLFEVW